MVIAELMLFKPIRFFIRKIRSPSHSNLRVNMALIQ